MVKAYFNKKWCPGDANGDGRVNLWDKGLLVDAWLTKRGDANWDSRVDFNADGRVNIWDKGILLDNWLKEYPDP